MRYRYQLVDRIPRQIDEGIVYHTEEFELAGLLCACGCGHRITLLVPDSHKVLDDDGYATIHPSVGVLDAPCKSHFIVHRGNVRWFPPFGDADAARVIRAQIARHVAHDAKPSLWQTVMTGALEALRKLRRFFIK